VCYRLHDVSRNEGGRIVFATRAIATGTGMRTGPRNILKNRHRGKAGSKDVQIATEYR
jgi:hypothetical protein